MTLHQVFGELYITDYPGAKQLEGEERADFVQVNVAFEHKVHLPKAVYAPWLIPANQFGQMQVFQPMLDLMAEVIALSFQLKKRVAINCNQCIERAPLSAAWYIYRKANLPFKQAYDLVKIRWPATQDRTQWIAPALMAEAQLLNPGPKQPSQSEEILQGLMRQRLKELEGGSS